jgi:hypothetical protein
MRKLRPSVAIVWRSGVRFPDDGRPPLDADGLQFKERLQEISDSIARVEQKRGFLPNSAASTTWYEQD